MQCKTITSNTSLSTFILKRITKNLKTNSLCSFITYMIKNIHKKLNIYLKYEKKACHFYKRKTTKIWIEKNKVLICVINMLDVLTKLTFSIDISRVRLKIWRIKKSFNIKKRKWNCFTNFEVNCLFKLPNTFVS